ncbi:hypothetical protein LUZ60_015691 [Juncus effusus]|nr:hypothetical protein LUZ60_015691 [Juncus effusus]
MLLLLLPLLLLSSASASASETLDPYKTLQAHGLPSGLFPKGITNFTLSDDGSFLATLNQSCTATVENSVKYNVTVTGFLSFGQMGSLTGVSAQELFLWFPVLGIRVDVPSSGVIYFDVGVVNKQLALSLFDVPPDCVPDSDGAGGDGSLEVYRAFSQSDMDMLMIDKTELAGSEKAIM